MLNALRRTSGLLFWIALNAWAQNGPGGTPPDPASAAFPRRTAVGPYGFEQTPIRLPPAPRSVWIEKEKEQFRNLLLGAKAEIFIAPVEVKGSGLDRSTRSLMAAELAAALAADYGRPTLNSYLVQRALGDGLRSIDLAEATELAGRTGALKTVMISAGHDRKSNLQISLQLKERASTDGILRVGRSREFIFPMGPDETAAEVFRAKVIPEIATELGLTRVPAAKGEEPPKFADFPNTVAQAIAIAAQHPLHEGMIYQLLGTLAPPRPEHARERLFEQSLIALQQLATKDATARLLSARATFYLHSRPAALAVLGKPASGPERALYAFFNGNLPEMEKAVATVESEVLRMMLEVDLQDLRHIYTVKMKDSLPAFVVATLQERPEWRPLFERRLQDLDPWHEQSNIELKMLLERTMSVKGFDLESMVRGMRTLNKEIDETELGMSALEHIRLLRGSEAEIRNCAPGKLSCAKSAYLDLVEAAVIFNAVQGIEKAGVRQAAPERAERLGKAVGMYLDGNPEFALAMSKTLLVAAQRAAPALRAGLMQTQVQYTHLAAFFEQGQSATAHQALVQFGVPSANSLPYLAVYGKDIPIRDYWFTGFSLPPEERLAEERTKLRYSGSNFDVAIALSRDRTLSETDRNALKDELADRFVGHPGRATLFAATSVQADSPESRRARFEAAKRERPDEWGYYSGYGTYLIESQGAYQEAAAIFLQFPGFKDQRGFNPVSLSNYAYESGSALFWRGAIAEARPLLKISADLGTGSGASISSRTRLDLLDGKFREAAAGSLERGSRYDDAYAYRDYLAWLFAFGKKREAWAAFDQLQAKLENPQVWLAAHVGQRIEHRSWAEIKTWLLTDAIRNTVVAGARPALAAAVLFNTVDRKPVDDLVDDMKQIEGEPLAIYDKTEVRIPHQVGGNWVIVGRSSFNPKWDASVEPGKLSSHLVMFADAYSSLRKMDYEGASAKFFKMSSFYPIEGAQYAPNYSYALVYFAWASARTQDQFKLEAFLDRKPPIYFERFDQYLAKAVFLGLRRDVSGAVSNLALAFDSRPYTEERPIFTEYQWAETCEWLFDATGEVRYRDLALAWARAHQKIQPMYAWAYAMEAKLTSSEPDRLRALGMTLYLDPLSDRASGFPEDVKQKARELFASTNPFKEGNDRPRPGAKIASISVGRTGGL